MLPKTKEALYLLAKNEFFKQNDIRFVGGTALSYLIKHRLSEDLDFAMLELPKQEIITMMNNCGAIKQTHSNIIVDSAINDGSDIEDYHLVFELNGVKVDFFVPPFNIKEKEIWLQEKFTLFNNTDVKVASFNTIIYMKTMAFWNRKKYRDIYDIYFVLTQNPYKYNTNKFIEEYIKYNITYSKELLFLKIQSKTEFYEKRNDEGINALVNNPKSYEWYRNKIESMVNDVYLEELYES